MDTVDAIRRRRSVREFTNEGVDEKLIRQVLEAGMWAPSGLNNQPWRFIVVQEEGARDRLSEYTKYGRIVQDAPVLIAVFLATESMYDRTKDVQAVGACIENMLLAVESLGLGAVWLGEILNKRDEVRKFLGAPPSWELMAVVAMGHPKDKERTSTRKGLDEVVWWERYV